MNITTVLLQATALMLVLILLRPALKKWFPAKIRCALWAIPALRLILPFEIRSIFSIFTAAKPVIKAAETAASAPLPVAPPAWLGSNIGLSENVGNTTDAVQNANTISLGNVLFIIWLAGAVISAIWLIWANARFFSKAKKLSSPLEIDCALPVYLLKGIPSPCLAGVFRPRIYVNECAMASVSVFNMTLRHELMHHKRLDHVWGLLRGLLTAVYWFHPLVWLSNEFFRRDCETACDEAVTRSMSADEKQEYGMALISLASRKFDRGVFVCLSTMSGGKKLLRERIVSLKTPHRAVKTTAVISAALAVVLFCTMCTSPKDIEDEDIPKDEVVDKTDIPQNNKDEEEVIIDIGAKEEGPSVPAQGNYMTASDVSYYLELSTLGAAFNDVDPAIVDDIISEYGGLLNGYKFIARGRVDGKGIYIVGEYTGDGISALAGMSQIGINDDTVIYRESDVDFDAGVFEKDVGTTIKNSSIAYSMIDPTLVLIQPKTNALYFSAVWNEYMWNGVYHILDAAQRGVLLSAPDTPYLSIYMISEIYGETCEIIPLTDDEAAAILAEERIELPEGHGFSATLHYGDDEDEYFEEYNGVPRSVIDLAVERCGYKFATPDDISGEILNAMLECSWLTEPLYASEDNLPRLAEILKNAKFDFVGGCGYGAKLTLELANGEKLTVFKGSDSCDSMVFGSYGGYSIGNKENTEFWDIFGLDPDTHEPYNSRTVLYDNGEIRITIPNQYKDLVIVDDIGSDNIFTVKANVYYAPEYFYHEAHVPSLNGGWMLTVQTLDKSITFEKDPTIYNYRYRLTGDGEDVYEECLPAYGYYNCSKEDLDEFYAVLKSIKVYYNSNLPSYYN